MKLLNYVDSIGRGAYTLISKNIGVPVSVIYMWAHGKRNVPIKHCVSIEQETNGAVTCEELRPDFDWAYLRNSRPVEKVNE